MANTQLAAGYGLTVSRPLMNKLSRTRLFNYDGFLMIEADPQLQKVIDDGVNTAGEVMRDYIKQKAEGTDL